MNHARTNRRAFTLIEAIVAILILAITTPVTLSVLADAASSRVDTITLTRATWYANTVIEHILADAASTEDGLGMEAFESPATYLDAPGSGLHDRLAPIVGIYQSHGLAHEVTISDTVAADGLATGSEELDVYRYITVTISWTSPRNGARSLSVSALVSEVAA